MNSNLAAKPFRILFLLLVLLSGSSLAQRYSSQTPNCDGVDYDYLIASYTEVLKKNPRDSEILYRRGAAFLQVGENDLALADFNASIEINAGNSSAYFHRGRLFAEWANYDRSITEFEKAIQLDPNQDEFFYMIGRSFGFLDQFDIAVKNANAAITINWKNPYHYYLRGRGLRKLDKNNEGLKDYKTGLTYLDEVISNLPNDPCQSELFILRGLFNKGLNNLTGAENDYRKAIELEPNFYSSYYYRAQLFAALGKNHLAIEDLSKAIELNPNFADSYRVRAKVFEQLRRTEQAQSDNDLYHKYRKK